MDFISRADLDFLLFNWLNVSALTERTAFSDHSEDTFRQIMDLSADMARDCFAPHYKATDQNEPRLIDGRVETLPEIRVALQKYAEAGFFASAFPEELGGMQMPMVVAAASFSHFAAASLATAGYAMLTGANARLLEKYGTTSQIQTWAAPQIEGRFFGTMCLSEPQAGSSLGYIKTRAVHDGSDDKGQRYRLYGNKMWISGGDHEISDNIVHLVLAKATGADGKTAAGSKALSLFVVPKFLPDGTRNDVAVAGLNHKMGYRGTVNCLLNFGEDGGAIGWRVGEEGQGLPIMFQMMNEARLMVGLTAAALAYRGLIQSTQYARERPQGRARGAQADCAADQKFIIEHADVKRMLLMQKAFAEGALALSLFTAKLIDDEATAPDPATRQEAGQLLGLLTPITKSWPSEFGLIANDQAIQIHGGYGYTREYDVEQLYRDNRLNPIHEGTYGIQGLDFVGRKLLADGGRAFGLLHDKIAASITSAQRHTALAPFAKDLGAHLQDAVTTLATLLEHRADPRALDNASGALSAYGHLVIGWLWLDQTAAALDLVSSRPETGASKLAACRYFFEHELPKITHQLALVRDFNTAASDVPSDVFA